MSKYRTSNIPLQRERFISAWREFAGEVSFAGVSLAEFEEATESTMATRDELETLRARQRGVLMHRKQADDAARGLMQRVANAVRASAVHGADSALYRSIGYIPQSERASGLTRKSRLGADDAPASMNAA